MSEHAPAAWPWPPRFGRHVALAEVAVVYALFFVCVWWILPLHSPALSRTCVSAIPVLVIASHLAHRDPLARIGFRRDTLLPCLRDASLIFAPCALALVALGLYYGPSRTWSGWLRSCATYPAWGLIQQCAFQAFAHNRLLEATGRRRWSAVLAALLFGFAHVPNVHLTVATLAGGAFFSYLFAKHRNLLPIALWHGLLGASFLHVAPRWLMPTLKIGPGAW
ncbi:MAG: CPBP family intramembrane metalloprotease [Planctomycetes bacterium]|nr:CPBP family intramembrane metalloprotease [Planctomycetota bacterium]